MYIGRFAPSPTGNLHFGSLVSALASFVDARYHRGKWLVRIEDMDPPREQQGADKAILNTLKAYHLQWDDDVLYQSTNHHRYYHHLQQLNDQQLLFTCDCTRARLRELGNGYDGHCRSLSLQSLALEGKELATRIKVEYDIEWNDIVQGHQHYNAKQQGGDFIVIRRDQRISYQIAVCVDDMEQGITRVVRGADLLESTARQCYLMHALNQSFNQSTFSQSKSLPEYCHVPMATHADGAKLSKQTAAAEIKTDEYSIRNNLKQALFFLGQPVPEDSNANAIDSILDWAITHWDITKIPKTTSQVVS